MLELGFDELMDFAEKWRTSPDEFREVVAECFKWAEKQEVEVDLIHKGRSGWGLQVSLRDARGQFFAEPVLMRVGMDVGRMFSAAVAKARRRRIALVTSRPIAARAA